VARAGGFSPYPSKQAFYTIQPFFISPIGKAFPNATAIHQLILLYIVIIFYFVKLFHCIVNILPVLFTISIVVPTGTFDGSETVILPFIMNLIFGLSSNKYRNKR
jgi:hypothetical protein